MYDDLKPPSDAGNELEAENVDKGDILMKQMYNLSAYFTLHIYVYLQLRCYKKKVINYHFKSEERKRKIVLLLLIV